MKTIKKLFFGTFLVLYSYGFAQGEFFVDADLRSRFEYRHGFNALFPDGGDAAAFVNQRTRLNVGYNHQRYRLFVSVQDISVWGDTRQILPVDGNDSFSLFQAWGEVFLDENWSVKAGRQVLSYDDQRIFGGLDWAMQGRFHDALLVKYKNDDLKIDVGGAFNQEGVSNFGTVFNIEGFFSYKSMQYIHAHNNWGKTEVSLLFLNTGFQKFEEAAPTEGDGVVYRQTAGTYTTFPIGRVKLATSGYLQFGKANEDTDLSAYQLGVEATYKPNNVLYGLGVELLSGTDQDGEAKNKSFFPLYGTNHKFNGYMDYFYVGNHANNVGLNDFYGKAIFDLSEKSNLLVKAHYFSANAELTADGSSYLGTEIDLVFTQKIIKNIKLNVGYSHMFAAEGMSLIQGGTSNDNTNNWAWALLTINPNIFKAQVNGN